MSKLKITKERVLEVAKSCEQAKATLEKLFPEVFEEEKYFDLSKLKHSNEQHRIFTHQSSQEAGLKKKNSFTKVQMDLKADALLLEFFKSNISNIENWFNVISPRNKNLNTLKEELASLKNKNWLDIL